MTARHSLFRSVFDRNGTASRKRGWLVLGVCLCGMYAILMLGQSQPGTLRWLLPFLGMLNAVLMVALVQRLHDAGRSGYWALLAAIPYLGALAILVNCDNSMDSRFAQNRGGLGFVPFENVVGRVSRILFLGVGPNLADVTAWRPRRCWRALE